MKFIDIILDNSTDKLAKLYSPALKASQNPENGITIQNKSAYHVIKDCAMIARFYIPLHIFEKYIDPFETLKGKFSKQNIQEFVQSTKTSDENYHLLCVILQKIEKNKKDQSQQEIIKQPEVEIIDNNPYGEYGITNEETKKYINQYSSPINDKATVELLCEMFGIA